jgi:hypothetical protein
VALPARERNLDKFKSGGLHEKHAVATWKLGNHLSICLKTEENQENLLDTNKRQNKPTSIAHGPHRKWKNWGVGTQQVIS